MNEKKFKNLSLSFFSRNLKPFAFLSVEQGFQASNWQQYTQTLCLCTHTRMSHKYPYTLFSSLFISHPSFLSLTHTLFSLSNTYLSITHTHIHFHIIPFPPLTLFLSLPLLHTLLHIIHPLSPSLSLTLSLTHIHTLNK